MVYKLYSTASSSFASCLHDVGQTKLEIYLKKIIKIKVDYLLHISCVLNVVVHYPAGYYDHYNHS